MPPARLPRARTVSTGVVVAADAVGCRLATPSAAAAVSAVADLSAMAAAAWAITTAVAASAAAIAATSALATAAVGAAPVVTVFGGLATAPAVTGAGVVPDVLLVAGAAAVVAATSALLLPPPPPHPASANARAVVAMAAKSIREIGLRFMGVNESQVGLVRRLICSGRHRHSKLCCGRMRGQNRRDGPCASTRDEGAFGVISPSLERNAYPVVGACGSSPDGQCAMRAKPGRLPSWDASA